MAITALHIPVLGKTISVFDAKCGNRSTKYGNNNDFGYLSQQLRMELCLSSSLHQMFASKRIVEEVSANYTAVFRLKSVRRHVLLQSSWYGTGLRSRICEHVRKFSFSENSVGNTQFETVSSLQLTGSSSKTSKGNNQLDVTVERNLEQKYRPKRFDDLVGQGGTGKFLKSHAHKNNVKPAYLFSGPRGAGKTSAARIFAASVNCEDRQNGNPCGNCRQCRTISKGSNTDVREIDAATNSGVESIRNLLETVRYSPQSARFKVYIIDECHMLSKEAASALLKTLEEPPSHVLFILVTTDPQKLLDSVVSRCDHFKFRKLTNDNIVLALEKVAEKEEIIIEEPALQLLGELSSGSLRDGLGMLGSVASVGEEITVELVEERFDVLPVSQMSLLLTCSLTPRNSERIKPLLQNALWRSDPYQVLVGLVQLIVDIFAKDSRLFYRMNHPDEEALRFLVNMSETEAGDVYLRRVLSNFRAAELQIRQAPYAAMWLNTALLELPLLQPLSLPNQPQTSETFTLAPPPPLSEIGNGSSFLTPEKVPALVSSGRVGGESSIGSLSRDMGLQESGQVKTEDSLSVQEKFGVSGLPEVEEKLGKIPEAANNESTEMESGGETVLGFDEEERESELDTGEVGETILFALEEELSGAEALEKEIEKVEDEKVEVVKPSLEGKGVVEDVEIATKTGHDLSLFSLTEDVMEEEAVEETVEEAVEESLSKGTDEEEEGEFIGKTYNFLEIKAQAEELIQTKSHKSLLKGKGRIVSISETTVALEFPIGCMAGARKPQTEKSFRQAFSSVLSREISISLDAAGESENKLSPVEGELSVKRVRRSRPRSGEVKGGVKGEGKSEGKGKVKGEETGEEKGEEKEEEGEEEGGYASKDSVVEGLEGGGGEYEVSLVGEVPIVGGRRKSRPQIVGKEPLRRKDEVDNYNERLSDDEAKEIWVQTGKSKPEKEPRKEKTSPREGEGGEREGRGDGKTWADEIRRFPSRPISELDQEENRNGKEARLVYNQRKGSEKLTETEESTETEEFTETEDNGVSFSTESGIKKTVKRGPNKLNNERRANYSRSRMMAVAQKVARIFDGMVWSH